MKRDEAICCLEAALSIYRLIDSMESTSAGVMDEAGDYVMETDMGYFEHGLNGLIDYLARKVAE